MERSNESKSPFLTIALAVLLSAGVCLAQTSQPAAPPPKVSAADSPYLKIPLADLVAKALPEADAALAAARTDADRDKAFDEKVVPTYLAMIDTAGADPRAHQWRRQVVDRLMNFRLKPVSDKTHYEISDPSQRDKALQSVDLADQVLLGYQAARDALDDMENKSQFDAAHDRLEDAVNQMKYQKAAMAFYREQFLWYHRTINDQTQAQLTALDRTVREFFAAMVSDEDTKIAIASRTFVGWSAVYSSQTDEACQQADAIIAAAKPAAQTRPDTSDAALRRAALTRFNAYAMKAQALRSAKAYGDQKTESKDPTQAFAAIEEQGKLLDEPGLKDEPDWKLFWVLGKANCIVMQAADEARAKLDVALKQSLKDPKAGGEAKNAALAAYSVAHDKAYDLFDQVSKSAPPAKQEALRKLVDKIKMAVWKDPKLDVVDPSAKVEVPPEADLKTWSWSRVKPLAERAVGSHQFEEAVTLYKDALAKVAKDPDAKAKDAKAEMMYDFARTCAYLAQKEEKEGNAKFKPDDLYNDADTTLAALLTEFPADERKAAIHELIFNAVEGETRLANRQFEILAASSKTVQTPEEEADRRKKADDLQAKLKDLRQRAIVEGKILLEGAKGDKADKADTYRAALGQLYMQGEDYRNAVTAWGQITPAFPKYLDVQEKLCGAVIKLYPAAKAGVKFDETQFKADMAYLTNFERLIKQLADARAATQPDAWKGPTTMPDPAVDLLAYRRFRAAQFRLQVGRLTIQNRGQAGIAEGTAILEKVPNDYPDLTNIKLWSNTFLLQGFLDRKEYDKAAHSLMVLIAGSQSGPPSVRRTEFALDSVLNLLTTEYKGHIAEGHMDDADRVAENARQFCEALLDEGRKAGLAEANINDILVRKAMTLNWLRKYDEAIGLLDKMYESDKALAATHKRDPDLSIELADSYFGAKKYREALDLYLLYADAEDSESAKANDFDPPIAKYSESYWRALIGGAECSAVLKEDVRTWRTLLMVADNGSKALFNTTPEPDPRVPPWLGKRRFDVVKAKLNELVPAAPTKARAPVETTVEKKDDSAWKGMFMVAGGLVLGLGLVMIVLVLKVRSQRKNKVVFKTKRLGQR